MTLDELVTLLDDGSAVLVEALSVAAYQAGHLPGAVNVPGPLSVDLAVALVPRRSESVVVYCSGPGCGRSTLTARAFEHLGYSDVRVYPGGKAEWAEAGLPLTSRDPVTGR
ncbi:rhodanese-like domain-containing protein [Kineosporia sp. R_H_3]|uniref:rhodanese-like domain-containing protein n=1 Tax=Kineosporia sp. R_H_3 TaxID=1961848 RepID=UPI0013043B44|nr:rhodanese-like domain-containing protein [Kineosporia sp. R_H_3]